MYIAVEGCCHGELDKIYETLQFTEQQNNIKIDLLFICGDFQAVRNKSDLTSMAVPPKYQRLNTFYKYYSGEQMAPVLTIFIGGNHEASNYLQELPYGGWVAPNIYYMGYAGVVQFGGLRIGGLSGIYKGHDYHRGHFEFPPYNDSTKRSVYHVRNLEVFRLKQLQQPLDIFLSHDWPRGIYDYGDKEALMRRKRFLADEVVAGTLGSPPAEEILHALKPRYWFSAHLHVKFAALIEFQMEDGASKATKFLALDKCLPRRDFLQVIEIHPEKAEAQELRLDAEWLCILKSTNHLLSTGKGTFYMPGLGSTERYDFKVSEDEMKSLCDDFGGNLKLPENFEKTAPPHESKNNKNTSGTQMKINPQTTLLCDMVGLSDPFALLLGNTGNISYSHLDASLDNSDFINSTLDTTTSEISVSNPDEIHLDDSDSETESDRLVLPPEKRVSLSPPKDNADRSDVSPQDSSVGVVCDLVTTNLAESTDEGQAIESSEALEPSKVPESSAPICESTPLKPKVIKRRNIAIYATMEDDLGSQS